MLYTNTMVVHSDITREIQDLIDSYREKFPLATFSSVARTNFTAEDMIAGSAQENGFLAISFHRHHSSKRVSDDKPVGAALVRLLEWDTAFFGFPCAAIETILIDGTGRFRLEYCLDLVTQIMEWCQAKNIRFISVKVPGPDPAIVQALEYFGFYVTENSVVLSLKNKHRQPEMVLPFGYEFTTQPLPMEDAVQVFRDIPYPGRFHNDSQVAAETADRIWESALANRLRKNNPDFLILEHHGQPVGLSVLTDVLPHWPGVLNHDGAILLLGIREDYRGQGWGRLMLTETMRRSRYRRLYARVSANNLAGIRLYQSAGFAVDNIRLSLHCWTPD